MVCFLTNNNSATLGFGSIEETNKKKNSCFFLSSTVCDLSPAFNPVTTEILDQDLQPAPPTTTISGKNIQFSLAVR